MYVNKKQILLIFFLCFITFENLFSVLKFFNTHDYLIRNRNNIVSWSNENAYLDYSLDSGRTWLEIGEFNSYYEWFLPNFKEKSVLLKVSNFLYSPPKLLWSINDAHNAEIKSIDISHNDSLLLSASSNGQIKIWDIKSKVCIDSLDYPIKIISLMSKFTNNEDEIIIFASDNIKIYNYKSKKYIDSFSIGNLVTDRQSFDYNKSTNTLAFASNKGEILVFDYNNKISTKSSFNLKNNSKIYSLKISSDGSLIAVGDEFSRVYLYTIMGDLLFSDTISINSSNPIWSIDITKNNSKLIAGSSDRIVKIWDLLSHSVLTEYKIHTAQIRKVRFSENYNMSASLDSTICFNLFHRKKNFTEQVSHNGQVIDCIFSDDDKYFASCGRDKSIKLWLSPEFEEISDTVLKILKYPIKLKLPNIITKINNNEVIKIEIEYDSIFEKDFLNFSVNSNLQFLYPNEMVYTKNSKYLYSYGIDYDTINIKIENFNISKKVFESIPSKILYTNKTYGLILLKNINFSSNEIYHEISDGSIRISDECIGDINRSFSFKNSISDIMVIKNSNIVNFKFYPIDESLNTFEIFDYLGMLIYTKNFESSSNQIIDLEVDFKYESKGLYFIILRNKTSLIIKKYVII